MTKHVTHILDSTGIKGWGKYILIMLHDQTMQAVPKGK